MRLARHQQLHGPLGVLEDPHEPVRIADQQVRALVGGEAAREAHRQHVGVEHRAGPLDLCRVPRLGRELPDETIPHEPHQAFAGVGPLVPERLVGEAAQGLAGGLVRPAPDVGAAGLAEQGVHLGRRPGRDVHAVGHVPHRHLRLRPAREERLEDAAAHLTVQPAHAVDRPASADRQVRHVERLAPVRGIRPPQGQQFLPDRRPSTRPRRRSSARPARARSGRSRRRRACGS